MQPGLGEGGVEADRPPARRAPFPGAWEQGSRGCVPFMVLVL